jgi:hypothetical protein
MAAATIESIAAALKTDVLIRSFLGAPPVHKVYKVLGQQPPTIDPPNASVTVKAQ